LVLVVRSRRRCCVAAAARPRSGRRRRRGPVLLTVRRAPRWPARRAGGAPRGSAAFFVCLAAPAACI